MAAKKGAPQRAAPGGAKGASTKKASPFDLKVNKGKFDILNRKVIGERGRPSLSRERALEIRSRTILPEISRRGRSSDFVDRRFGERNAQMSSEDKMLQRFSHERMRKSKKKAAFNLNEESSDYSNTLTLTHKGRSVSDIDAFDSDLDASSDDDDDGGLDHDFVKESHFGGGSQPERTKAEIMQEVIAKSKSFKHQRQKLKDENDALCEDLDGNFAAIMGSLATRERGKEEAKTADDGDDYNAIVSMMTFDRRSTPSDRTKTEDEVREGKQKALERATKERAKRMASGDGEGDYDGEDDGEARRKDKESAAQEEVSDAERDIRRVMGTAEGHLDNFCNAPSETAMAQAYGELVALCRTNSVIPVARVIRARLAAVARTITRAGAKGPVMPPMEVLMLLHLVGRVFSTSDYHHIVATPAILIIGAFLERGRMLRRAHVASAVFLLQTALAFQGESRRSCPEVFSFFIPLLVKFHSRLGTTGRPTTSPFPADRLMSRTVHDFITDAAGEDAPIAAGAPLRVSFEHLYSAFEDESAFSRELLASHLASVAIECRNVYGNSPCAVELLDPIASILATCNSPIACEFVAPRAADGSPLPPQSGGRRPIMLQTFKPTALPQLVPDLDDGMTKEEKASRRISRSYKRELKGAKRELKRDSAFLLQEKLKRRLEDDKRYAERMRQIVGSIANDGAASGDASSKRPRR